MPTISGHAFYTGSRCISTKDEVWFNSTVTNTPNSPLYGIDISNGNMRLVSSEGPGNDSLPFIYLTANTLVNLYSYWNTTPNPTVWNNYVTLYYPPSKLRPILGTGTSSANYGSPQVSTSPIMLSIWPRDTSNNLVSEPRPISEFYTAYCPYYIYPSLTNPSYFNAMGFSRTKNILGIPLDEQNLPFLQGY